MIDSKLLAELADLISPDASADLLAGLGGSNEFPSISLNGTRFMVNLPGEEPRVILDAAGNVASSLQAVVFGAWPNPRKTFYLQKYDPKNPTKEAPDCFSEDGVSPDPAARNKQSENCAACQHNQFGTAVGADGNAGGGKRCTDKKRLIVCVRVPGADSTMVYHLDIPPASFKNFATYVREMQKNGVTDLVVCQTIISFDPAFTYPVLAFRFGQLYPRASVQKLLALRETDDVRALAAPTVKALPAPKPPVVEAAKPVEAPKPAPEPAKAAPPALSVVPAAPAPTPPAAPGLDLFADMAPPPQSVADLNDDELARSLGL